MPMETRHDLEHTTERLTEGLRCPWKWGHCLQESVAGLKGSNCRVADTAPSITAVVAPAGSIPRRQCRDLRQLQLCIVCPPGTHWLIQYRLDTHRRCASGNVQVRPPSWVGTPTHPTGGQPGPRHTTKYVSARDNAAGRADSDRAGL